MENHLNDVDENILAEQLESGIERGSVDDVRAAINKGARVSSRYEVNAGKLVMRRLYMLKR